MKKIYLCLVVICMSMHLFSVHAMDFYLYEGISIKLTGLDFDDEEGIYPFEGSLEILIQKDIMNIDYLNEPVEAYKEAHPHFNEYTFLENDGWVSYLAYVGRANIDEVHFKEAEGIVFNFGVSHGHSRFIKSFKVIYHMDGEIIWTTDEIILPKLSFYERYHMGSHLAINIDNANYTSFYQPSYNPMITLNIVILSIVLMSSIAARFIILKIFSIEKKDAPHFLIISTVFLLIIFYIGLRLGFYGFSWIPIRLNPFFNKTWPYLIYVTLLLEKFMYLLIYRTKTLIKPLIGLTILHTITCGFLVFLTYFFS